jgi:hypothetical protein
MESSECRLWTSSTLPRGGIAMLGGGFWDRRKETRRQDRKSDIGKLGVVWNDWSA